VTDAEWLKAQHQAKIELPKEIQRQIQSIFLEFAGDNESIMVDRRILAEILTRVGWDLLPGELDAMIHKYKFDEDLQEFSYPILLGMLYNKIRGEISDSELRAAFRAFDQDNNGKIDKKELQEAFKCLDKNQFTSEECASMLAEADVDKDGCIDIDEFISLLTSSKRPLLKHLGCPPPDAEEEEEEST